MCMQPVEDNTAFQMGCLPVPHRFHTNCRNKQPEHMKPFCRVCSQQPLGELELAKVGELFGFEEIEGSADAYPPAGRQILERLLGLRLVLR